MLRNGCRAFHEVRSINSVLNPSRRCLSTFQVKKIEHEFNNVFDRNKDGFVCTTDINTFKKALDNYHALQAGVSKGDDYLISNKYKNFWYLFTKLADKNGDGLISRDEWLDMWDSINKKVTDHSIESLPMGIRLLPSAIFPLIDTKRDGQIDYQEFKSFWKHIMSYQMADEEKGQKMFNEMTEFGRSPINLRRFEELYADYYISSNPDTPGRYIVGAIDIEQTGV